MEKSRIYLDQLYSVRFQQVFTIITYHAVQKNLINSVEDYAITCFVYARLYDKDPRLPILKKKNQYVPSVCNCTTATLTL